VKYKDNLLKQIMAALSIAQKVGLLSLGVGASGLMGVTKSLDESVKADLAIHPPSMKWTHSGPFNSLDHSSIRRGYQVYKQVCSACHSMKFISYRHLRDIAFTEAELKAEAAEIKVMDGPNDQGEMFERDGKHTDYFPKPYPNDKAAAYANNGAVPPDLSYIALARHGGEDYIFHLLTSYCDAPAGVEVPEGQHFNPYMLGGKIAMAAPLYNEVIEYDDGTPATLSQLAKDVCTFLVWAGSPEHDERKQIGIKAQVVLASMFLLTLYVKRHKWSVIKTQKLVFNPRKT